MTFWSSKQSDPRRKFNFKVTFAGDNGLESYEVKTVTKPKFTVNTIEAKFLDKTYKYPGNVTWDPISITMVDTDKAAKALYELVTKMGYTFPEAAGGTQKTISKENAIEALTVTIEQHDSNGVVKEKWTLTNAFITSFTWGDLAYGDDELVELQIEMAYDNAELD